MSKDPTTRHLWAKAGILFINFIYLSGCGSYGTPSEPAGSGVPAAPVLVTATPNQLVPNSIVINWVNQPTTGTNYNYNIYESFGLINSPDVSPSFYTNKLSYVGLPPTTLTKLTSGTTYYFVVTTVDASTGLESLPSSPVVSATAP